jgi:hypothetical protein
VPASAQIYSWRDANGTLVLSDRRPPTAPEAIRSYEVPRSQAIRATRYVAAERSRPFEDLIVENARQHGVRPDLVRAVMQVESAFNARDHRKVLSPCSDRTARQHRERSTLENVRAASLSGRCWIGRQRRDAGTCGYNAGPSAVDRNARRARRSVRET